MLANDFWIPLEHATDDTSLFKKKIARFLFETRERDNRLLVSQLGADDFGCGIILDWEEAEALYKIELNPLQKYQQTLLNINSKTKVFGESLSLKENPYLVPTFDDDELLLILEALEKDGLISFPYCVDDRLIQMTPKGLHAAVELSHVAEATNRVFIAACFSPDLDSPRQLIFDTVKDLGYEPYLVNIDPHNDLIDLKIYDYIRQSRFVVADLTYNRQSVYYEIGFAHGLGLQVVLTCRSDSFDSKDDESRRVHFDLNHRNVLCWNDEQDLKEKLEKHLLMCFGRFVAD